MKTYGQFESRSDIGEVYSYAHLIQNSDEVYIGHKIFTINAIEDACQNDFVTTYGIIETEVSDYGLVS